MHDYFMQAALEQAWLGRGRCAPNPAVGAVAVKNGEIIARAWHQGAGTAHAEQLVFDQLPAKIPEVTLYVTLEPCNHWGKTPPCVEEIIRRGVARVVYGFRDPNPVVAVNDTPRILEKNGIEVIHYPTPAVEKFYESYAYWTLNKMPWVTVKMAQSLDGRIAGTCKQRVYLSNQQCNEFTHQQRKHTDLILTTAKTVLHDDPQLNVRLGDELLPKNIALLDRTLRVTEKARIFSTAKHVHLFHDQAIKPVKAIENCTYHGLPLTNGLLDLSSLFKQLGQLGFQDVWVEAGGEFFSALHHNNFVHRTYLYISAHVLGDSALSAYQGQTIFIRKPAISWQIKGDNVVACLDWQEI